MAASLPVTLTSSMATSLPSVTAHHCCRCCLAARAPRMRADEGDEAARWLSTYLGLPVRLARYAGQAGAPAPPAADPQRRAVDPDWAPPGSAAETAFADGFPFLLASEASVHCCVLAGKQTPGRAAFLGLGVVGSAMCLCSYDTLAC